MAAVIPAEGVVLERVLEAEHAVSPEGLSREAYARCDAAEMKTAGGRHHRRRFALVDGLDVLASATHLPRSSRKRPVRVCVAVTEAELSVTESSRRGAPMTLIRGGEERDSGARVGAILQELIAREPAERRPTIRAWLPRGFVPQVTMVSVKPSTDALRVRSLDQQAGRGAPGSR